MKRKFFPAAVAVVLILPLLLHAEQKRDLSPAHKQWLEEEVAYIITPAEKEVFLKLETERDRERFIEEFWRQRDPTPGTRRNEFREEHYARIAFADRTFGRGSPIKGWQTDRGKFYIMLGRPASVQKYSALDVHPIEIWYYSGNPKLGQAPIFRLVFFRRGGMNVYELYDPMRDGPKELIPFHGRYPDIAEFGDQGQLILDAATAAEIGEMAHQLDGRDIQAYMILKENFGHELAEASFSNFPGRKGPTYRLPSAMLIKEVETYPLKKIDDAYAYEFLDHKAVVDVSYSVHYIGNQSTVDVLQHPSGIFFVNYTLVPENLSVDFYKDKYFTNLKASLRVADPAGKTIFQMERNVPIELKKEELEAIGKRPFHLYDFFPIIPGNYTFNLLLENTVSREFTSFQTTLNVPEPGRLQMSSLIFARNVKTGLPAGEIHRAYQVGDIQIYPTVNNLYMGKDTLYLLFQIYHLTPELIREGVLRYVFYREGQTSHTFEKKISDYQSDRDFLEEISLEELLPGRYSLKIVLIDGQGKELLTGSEDFTITDADLPGTWVSAQTSPPLGDPFYANILGIQHMNKGNLDKALQELSAAYEKQPASLDYALDYARALLISKDFRKVKEILAPFDESENAEFDLFYYLGEASKKLLEYENAVHYYQRSLAYRGNVVEILNSLGSCYLELGNTEEALRAWEKSLEIKPDQEEIKRQADRLKKKID